MIKITSVYDCNEFVKHEIYDTDKKIFISWDDAIRQTVLRRENKVSWFDVRYFRRDENSKAGALSIAENRRMEGALSHPVPEGALSLV